MATPGDHESPGAGEFTMNKFCLLVALWLAGCTTSLYNPWDKPQPAPQVVERIVKMPSGKRVYTRTIDKAGKEDEAETLTVTIDGDDNAPFDVLSVDPYLRAPASTASQEEALRRMMLQMRQQAPMQTSPAPAAQPAGPAPTRPVIHYRVDPTGNVPPFGGDYYGNK